MLALQDSSMMKSLLNCRGKMESEFLPDTGFKFNKASVVFAMLRNMIENTACS
jgi:hypothetical protein